MGYVLIEFLDSFVLFFGLVVSELGLILVEVIVLAWKLAVVQCHLNLRDQSLSAVHDLIIIINRLIPLFFNYGGQLESVVIC